MTVEKGAQLTLRVDDDGAICGVIGFSWRAAASAAGQR
jgi:hypothetical protein